MKRFFGVFVFLFVLTVGCISVSTNTNVNQDYADKHYNNVIVICTNDDEGMAAFIEGEAEKYFKANKFDWVRVIGFSKGLYQGSSSSDDKFKKKLREFVSKKKADAILFVSNGSANSESYISGMTATKYGFLVNRGTVTGVGMSVELFDASTRESVWYSRGGASKTSILLGPKDLMSEFFKKSIENLCRTGLVDRK